jgi:hypothetical protein
MHVVPIYLIFYAMDTALHTFETHRPPSIVTNSPLVLPPPPLLPLLLPRSGGGGCLPLVGDGDRCVREGARPDPLPDLLDQAPPRPRHQAAQAAVAATGYDSRETAPPPTIRGGCATCPPRPPRH